MTLQPLWSPVASEHLVAQRAEVAAAAAPLANAEPDLIGRIARWPIAQRRRALVQTFTGIAAFVAMLRFPSFIDGEWSAFFAHLRAGGFVLAWMLLVSLVVRTVTPRQLFSCWLNGVFVSGILVDLVGSQIERFVSGNAFNAVVVPVLEEGMKILPAVLFALLSRRNGRGFAAVDLGLLGAASGAGFAMYEDMLWGRRFVSGLGDGWSNLVPTILQDPLFVAGHAVWSATLAMGVGLMVVHRHTARAWLLGPWLIAIPLLDHAAINYRGDEYASLRAALQDGRLGVMAMVAALVIVMFSDGNVLRRSGERDFVFGSRSFGDLVKSPFPQLFSAKSSTRQFQRVYNSVMFNEHLSGTVYPGAITELASIEARLVQSTPAEIEGEAG